MKHLNKNLSKILILISVTYFIVMCSNTPTDFDLWNERNNIPWEKITGKIAYLQINYNSDNTYKAGNLVVIDGNLKRLEIIKRSNDPTVFSNLCWADGSMLTYSQLDQSKFEPSKYVWQLYNLDIKTGQKSVVYSNDRHNSYPAWSKDGRLAYLEGWYGIWIDDQIFYNSDTNLSRPAWSPDGQFLVAAIRDSTSQGALYQISLSDTSAVPLVQGTGEFNYEVFYDPIYSPDGKNIAFVKTSSDQYIYGEIWSINADGTEPRKLTSGHSDWHPAWSPEGDFILFARNDQLYLVKSDGSELTRITNQKGTYPTWIP